MDIEKRMNLSLDDIIQGRQKQGKSGSRPGRASGPKTKTQESRNRQPAAKQTRKSGNLRVKRAGIKKQSGERSINSEQTARKDSVRKGNVSKRKSISARLNSSLGSPPSKPRSGKGKSARPSGQTVQKKGSKRVVEIPKASNLRITIQNDRVYQQPAFQAAQPAAVNYGAPVGYGPRNLPARDELTSYPRPVTNAPLNRRTKSSDFGVSQRILGSRLQQRMAPLVDYDNPAASQSYMRMDTR